VLVVASVGDACRDEWPVGVVVSPQNWMLSGVVEEEQSKGRRRECSQIVGRCAMADQRRRLLRLLYQS
jgi:hypothetical protein